MNLKPIINNKTFFNKKIIKKIIFYPLYLLTVLGLFGAGVARNELEDKDFRKVLRKQYNLSIFQNRHIIKIDNQCYLTPNDVAIHERSHPGEDVFSVLLKKINGFFVTFVLKPNDKDIKEYYKKHVENDGSNTYKVKKNGIEYSIITEHREAWDLITAFGIDSELAIVSINLVLMRNPISEKQYSDTVISILEDIKPTPCRN